MWCCFCTGIGVANPIEHMITCLFFCVVISTFLWLVLIYVGRQYALVDQCITLWKWYDSIPIPGREHHFLHIGSSEAENNGLGREVASIIWALGQLPKRSCCLCLFWIVFLITEGDIPRSLFSGCAAPTRNRRFLLYRLKTIHSHNSFPLSPLSYPPREIINPHSGCLEILTH